mmetsp:Transcript_57880/g.67542  ORF Transcript_57880/g.67542 Transcript_57880/m.67542 type:complete len:83 (-) Transcript_57880:430-678(-)
MVTSSEESRHPPFRAQFIILCFVRFRKPQNNVFWARELKKNVWSAGLCALILPLLVFRVISPQKNHDQATLVFLLNQNEKRN